MSSRIDVWNKSKGNEMEFENIRTQVLAFLGIMVLLLIGSNLLYYVMKVINTQDISTLQQCAMASSTLVITISIYCIFRIVHIITRP